MHKIDVAGHFAEPGKLAARAEEKYKVLKRHSNCISFNCQRIQYILIGCLVVVKEGKSSPKL